MTITYYIDNHGDRHATLPSIWENTSPITEAWALSHGWEKHTEEIPEPVPEPVRYSKYKIKIACEKRNLWNDVKTAIENAGKWDSFLIIQDIAGDNPELLEALPAIREAFGSQVVDEVLAESIED